jgi:hypothetical protein
VSFNSLKLMNEQNEMTVDVDDEGRTSGYIVETYLCPIESLTQREGESFVRISLDPGGGTNSEVRIPVEVFRDIAAKLAPKQDNANP